MIELYGSAKLAFKAALITFIPIIGLAFVFGNFHAGLGGYFSVAAAYMLFPFHVLAPIFNYSGSMAFWLTSFVLEFLTIYAIYFIFIFFIKVINRHS